eukprot:1157562-Pelagomonas_calceolata.AAC.1
MCQQQHRCVSLIVAHVCSAAAALACVVALQNWLMLTSFTSLCWLMCKWKRPLHWIYRKGHAHLIGPAGTNMPAPTLPAGNQHARFVVPAEN